MLNSLEPQRRFLLPSVLKQKPSVLVLIWLDSQMSHIPKKKKKREREDKYYIDPPFNTTHEYRKSQGKQTRLNSECQMHQSAAIIIIVLETDYCDATAL